MWLGIWIHQTENSYVQMPISIKVKKVGAMLNMGLWGKLISKLESLKTLKCHLWTEEDIY